LGDTPAKNLFCDGDLLRMHARTRRRALPAAGHPPVYMDLASLGALPKYTCGQLYHFAAFSPKRDGPRLSRDVAHNLTRPTAWEVCARAGALQLSACSSAMPCFSAIEAMQPCWARPVGLPNQRLPRTKSGPTMGEMVSLCALTTVQ
jgi:hypothetical protein